MAERSDGGGHLYHNTAERVRLYDARVMMFLVDGKHVVYGRKQSKLKHTIQVRKHSNEVAVPALNTAKRPLRTNRQQRHQSSEGVQHQRRKHAGVDGYCNGQSAARRWEERRTATEWSTLLASTSPRRQTRVRRRNGLIEGSVKHAVDSAIEWQPVDDCHRLAVDGVGKRDARSEGAVDCTLAPRPAVVQAAVDWWWHKHSTGTAAGARALA